MGRAFGLRDDGIEFVRGVDKAVAFLAFRLDVGNLGLGTLDSLVHVGNVETDLVEIRHLALPGHHFL